MKLKLLAAFYTVVIISLILGTIFSAIFYPFVLLKLVSVLLAVLFVVGVYTVTYSNMKHNRDENKADREEKQTWAD